jgi:large subunit ribosomal protein L4
VEVPVYNLAGEEVDKIELSDAVFGLPMNTALVHQAMVRQLANKRQGTHATKTRGMITGSGRKLWRQKGTGRARHGSIKSPTWRGGGVVFGPHPRDYTQRMPKKMRRQALRTALSGKLAAQQILLLDEIEFAEPKTKQMVSVLGAFAVRSALVVLPNSNLNVQKSARNIPNVKTLPVQNLNVLDVLNHQHLIMPVAAARRVEQALGPTAEQA